MLKKQVARELQKRCATGLKENVSNSCFTEEDFSNDGAFDLVLSNNIPPSKRQVRCLPKDKKTFSSTAEKSDNTSVSAHI